MRAAPGIGAFIMALVIAYLPPMRHAGKTLLWCVTGFGLATIIFGLSPYLWLSLAMLFMTGVFDSVSVVVRHTLLQLVTPDSMRGRISAVNNIFIGTSNELGAFESGLTAALFLSGDLGRGRRRRNDPRGHGRLVRLAGDAQDRRARQEFAVVSRHESCRCPNRLLAR